MNSRQGRRLPPFGNSVAKKLLARSYINLFIFAGKDAWERARKRINHAKGDALVLPPGEKPQSYKWPVKKLDVLLIWPEGEYASICQFAELLVQQGAKKVIAPWLEDKDGILSFYPVQQRGAA